MGPWRTGWEGRRTCPSWAVSRSIAGLMFKYGCGCGRGHGLFVVVVVLMYSMCSTWLLCGLLANDLLP